MGSPGPCGSEIGESSISVDGVKPWSSAVKKMNGLIVDPGCRFAWVARSNWLISKLKPPVIASTRPVCGSIATRAPETSGTWHSVKAADALALAASPFGADTGIGWTITTSPGLTTSAARRGYGPKLPEPCHGRAQRISENGI